MRVEKMELELKQAIQLFNAAVPLARVHCALSQMGGNVSCNLRGCLVPEVFTASI